MNEGYMKTFTVGIVGLGTVGQGVYTLLMKKAAHLRSSTGIAVEIKSVCEKNKGRLRALKVPKKQQAISYEDVVGDPAIDCVIELVGGVGIAERIILDALRHGKDVVTANKALLAEKGDGIFTAAKTVRRQVYFEASVGGGIPIIKSMRDALVANHVHAIYGIINGTSNYILSKMTNDEMDFQDALALAQKKGYAEANPALDINGTDSAHKLAILARLAFQAAIKMNHIYCEGIAKIRRGDIAYARQLGYVIKLLAIAKKTQDGVELRVQPTFLPEGHILASVDDSYNAIYLMCDEVENMLFYGRGAGARPTASAVVSDIIDAARTAFGAEDTRVYPVTQPMQLKNMSLIQSRYYLRCTVYDRPGVLAKLSAILGTCEVSISDVIQKERKIGGVVPVVLLTHETMEKNLNRAIRRINTLSDVHGQLQVIRIEE